MRGSGKIERLNKPGGRGTAEQKPVEYVEIVGNRPFAVFSL
jgi:hypothetical protein